jgi:hypothetical protein
MSVKGSRVSYWHCPLLLAATRHPLPDIVTLHPLPDIVTLHPLPDTRYPTSATRHPLPDIRYPTSVTRHPLPDIRHLLLTPVTRHLFSKHFRKVDNDAVFHFS